MTPNYQKACDIFRRIERFKHLTSLASWDQATLMPEGGSDERCAAISEVQTLCHQILTAPLTEQTLMNAEQENLTPTERTNWHEMMRSITMSKALPEALVVEKNVAGSRCEMGWRKQRPANDWKGFLENFEPVVAASRKEAHYLSQALGLAPYDALMEKFEPGFGSALADELLSDVMQWLPDLIVEAQQHQQSWAPLLPARTFESSQQKELGLEVMGLLGFDFNRGRLDTSLHPFCGGMTDDVRITTCYSPENYTRSLYGIIHETGHALYEQHLPSAWKGLPIGQSRSMAVHESQSLFHEMQLGTHESFLKILSPLLHKHLGPDPAFESANLVQRARMTQPGFIRVKADELTYPAHIALRFEIEKKLIEGQIEARDIPALWDERMLSLLGLDTRNNYKDGPLQDIHWTDGSFGYFPSYTLGALIAAQLFSALNTALPNLSSTLEQGDLSPIRTWLHQNIWSKASSLSTHELIQAATGEPISTRAYRAHLRSRYTPNQTPQPIRPKL